jgi:D-glycero-D-manno-heptose 1,7-bisphosphate phosphatase
MIQNNTPILDVSKRLVILDRDGVINYDSDAFIKTEDEWQAIPQSLEAIALLNQAGVRVVICTNQSGLHRGLFDMPTLNKMHQKMKNELQKFSGEIDAIFFCPHTAQENCTCRKPKPGMLEEIQRRYHVNLQGVPMVGDSLRDLQAGAAMNCSLHLVLTGKGTKTLNADTQLPMHTLIHNDLMAFAQHYLELLEQTNQ